jgi:hypothetical protein
MKYVDLSSLNSHIEQPKIEYIFMYNLNPDILNRLGDCLDMLQFIINLTGQ